MRFIERKRRLEYLLEMIEKGRCISVQQVSECYNCSERTIKRMIAELRDEGHHIHYCKIKKKYLKKN